MNTHTHAPRTAPPPTTYLDETWVKFYLAHKSQMVNSGNSLESTDPH